MVMEINEVKSKITRRHLYINGEWMKASSKETFLSTNPATGETLSEVDFADETDVDAAVSSAAKALHEWKALDPDERGRRLHRVAGIIREREEELAIIDTLDCGRPITDTRYKDIPRTQKTIEFFAGLTDKIRGATIPTPGNFLNYTVKEPYGVLGAIIPWNYPFSNAITKIAPAVACGNTVVLKPSEQTPLSALELGPIFKQAGIPDGVLNIITGDGRTGAALTNHPLVRKIAFTGSTLVGKKILQASQFGIKSYTLELGGKSPNIVFADANADQASDAALFSIFMNQGQTCTAGTRLFVDDGIYDEFVDILLRKAKLMKVGDPLDPATRIGSIVSKEQYERVCSYIETGKQEATLLLGGDRPTDESTRNGYFINPTIFVDVKNDSTIAREEIFGPVLSIIRFKNEEDLLQMANDTEYGLACAIWTRDITRAHRVAQKLEAGLVWINTIHTLSPGSPYGGYKQSGIGLEMGLEAIDQYMKTKSIWVNLGEYKSPWT
jgi:acyl-CoA reductase-like NAD-dependent aldehyde dehydrogenase